jgi:hypothetical protein
LVRRAVLAALGRNMKPQFYGGHSCAKSAALQFLAWLKAKGNERRRIRKSQG